MTIAVTIKPSIGLGDALQFSSLPENYFRATGKKLIDISRPWFFDHNPYVDREPAAPSKTIELWNHGHAEVFAWPNPRLDAHLRPAMYTSNAEIWAAAAGVPIVLNRPRLYRYEDYPFTAREMILLHIDGKSHGVMPEHVIKHIVSKYGPTRRLYQIGLESAPRIAGIPRIETPTLWDLARLLSQARMLIGMDSGPSWVAACYPDVIVKKLRIRQSREQLSEWVPLEIQNIHAHWDDRCHQVFNPFEDDAGFTSSYRKI